MNLQEENEKLRGLLRECAGQIDLLIEIYVEDDVEPEDIAISEQIKADVTAALSQQAEPDADGEHARRVLETLLSWQGEDWHWHFEQFPDLAKRVRAQLPAKAEPAPAQAAPQHCDDEAVDRFAAAMKVKLAAARAKGRGGWDDPSVCAVEFLARLLIGHLSKSNAGTFEDVANFAMMLHQRGADPKVLAEAAEASIKKARGEALELGVRVLESKAAPQPEQSGLVDLLQRVIDELDAVNCAYRGMVDECAEPEEEDERCDATDELINLARAALSVQGGEA